MSKRYIRVLDEHYGFGKKRSKNNLDKLKECSYCGNLFDKSRLDFHDCNRQLKFGGVAFDASYYGHNEDDSLKAPNRSPRDKHKSKIEPQASSTKLEPQDE